VEDTKGEEHRMVRILASFAVLALVACSGVALRMSWESVS
jgi:hypothetical protein